MNRLLLNLIFVCAALSAQAQISHGGQPFDWNFKTNENVIFETLPPINREALDREDRINDAKKDIPYRFGQNFDVDFDLNNSGSWTQLENGDRVWRLGIIAEGAQSINFFFDTYQIPEGGQVFVYDAEKIQLLGSFTHQNANENKTLAVGFVLSDRIVISYREPADAIQPGYLHINQITHGYRNAFANEKAGPFGNSGACNINVNCPQGLPYEIQKRSVGLIVLNGNSKCTGALVNTTARDKRPYFLTARHCLGNSDNWVIYFNHETPDCDGQEMAPTDQSISGTTTLAWHEESDFALVELTENVPESYNVCYSGWDATDDPQTVLSAYGIHHPKGDVKKISIENDAPTQTAVGSFVNEVWFVDQWEEGVTEGGSSGSPLFNQSGLIIGQLAGGMSMCVGDVNNGKYDFYGRLGVSWDFGYDSVTRLKDWLDPINTGEKIVENSCTVTTPAPDASIAEITGIEETTCDLMPVEPQIRVLNTGTVPVNSLKLLAQLNGIGEEIIWNGDLEVFSSEFISLGTFAPQNGDNILLVEILEVNGQPGAIPTGKLKDHTFYGFDNTKEVTVDVAFDNYPLETSWYIENSSGEILYEGSGNYDVEQISKTLCLGQGCYTFVIKDSDGICCYYGQGWYTVTGEDGETLASGGDFNLSEETEFCIVTSNTNHNEKEFVKIFPNPTNDRCHVFLGDTTGQIQAIKVLDARGRVLLEKNNFNPDMRLWSFETKDFSEGVYLIVIETDTQNATRRVVVSR